MVGDCKPGMDTPINPDSLLVATASFAHLSYFDVSALIGLANNLNEEGQDISCYEVKTFYLSADHVTEGSLKIVKVAVHVLKRQEAILFKYIL